MLWAKNQEYILPDGQEKSDFKTAIKKVYRELKKNINWDKKLDVDLSALTIYWPDKKYFQSEDE